MNDMSPVPETGTSLALTLPSLTELEAMLMTEGGMDATVASLKAAAAAKAAGADVNTVKGRDLMKSAAYDLSKSKVDIVKGGKALTEEAREKIAAINAGIRAVETALDDARDEMKRPALEWEAADKARKDRITAILDGMRNHGMGAENTSEELKAKAAEVKGIAFDDFGDQLEQAEMVRETTLVSLRTLYTSAKVREDQAAELEALRAEKAERGRLEAERDRLEAERLAKEQAEQVEREAKERAEQRARADRENLAERLIEHIRKAAAGTIDGKSYPIAMLMHEVKDRVLRDADGCGEFWPKVEAERSKAIAQLDEAQAAEVERDRIEAEQRAKAEAERIQREADERAAKERQDAAAREAALQRQIEAQRRETEAAAQRERDRIEAERQAEADARAKREADQAHLARIEGEIAAAIAEMLDSEIALRVSNWIAEALMAGKIPHCEVRI